MSAGQVAGEMNDGARTTRVAGASAGEEIVLAGGDVTDGVVRVGDTVRRPHQAQSDAIAAFLHHLERAGFDGAPRFLGRDDAGRDVLTFLAGDVPGQPPEAWAADDGLLASVALLLRRLHDAAAGFGLDPGETYPGETYPGETYTWYRDTVSDPTPWANEPPELIAHLDVTPQNVIVRDGQAVAVIDFDLAGPATRRLDVYNTAMHWVPLCPPEDLWPAWRDVDQLHRLRLFIDAYGLPAPDRAGFARYGVERAAVSWERMRVAAREFGGGWARMWDEGVGDLIRRRQAWLGEHADEIDAAIGGAR